MTRWSSKLALAGGVILGILAVGASVPTPTFPSPPAFYGHVADVIDGDSLTALRGGRPVEVRLFDVDCPELDTRRGEDAKRATAGAVLGRRVWVFPSGLRDTDQHGRLLARVWTPNGWLSDVLIRKGLATRYVDPDDPEKGLVQGRVSRLPTAAPTRPPQAKVAARAAPAEKGEPTVFITPSGARYHRADCAHIGKNHEAVSLSEAKSRGYTPCAACDPPQ